MEMLERYINEIEEDLKIDQFNIKEASLKTPGRKHFWVSRLINHKRNLQSLENKKLDLKKQIMDQIHDQSPVKLSTYTVDKTSDDSGMIREIQVKINEEKLIIEFLEKTEKIFSSLTYDIKNIIEIMKLEQL